MADPVPPPGPEEEFADEHGSTGEDPFVGEPDQEPDIGSEPLSGTGPAPDPGDLPAEWRRETPAEEIEPSDAEELMIPEDELSADGGPAADAVPRPPSKSLPRTLDAAPGWQYSYSCDPNDKPGMVAFAELVSKHYNRPRYYTSRSCKHNNFSQHHEGRAVDWSMNAYNSSDKAIGDAVAYWLTKNNGEMARRFGVQSVIWNKRSWYLYSPGSWRSYNGPSPHTDHLHISFTWDGAMKRTSWWTGRPVTTIDHGTCRKYAGQYAPRYSGRNTRRCSSSLPNPPSSNYPVTLPGARNDNVKVAQRALGFTGSSVDGAFGPMTLKALLGYQRNKGLYRTGVLTNATWNRMERTLAYAKTRRVLRVGGTNRYATAAKMASYYPTGGDVYITTGQNFPDAVAAGARAGYRNDPVLLTTKTRLPSATITQLKRIKPRRVFIVGGSGAVSYSVGRSLRKYVSSGSSGIIRLSGNDRYGTAGAVARQFGSRPTTVYVATGAKYHDALVAAARAGHRNAPVLLTKRHSVPSATRSALRAVKPERIVVVGRTDAVSSTAASTLKRYATKGSLVRVSSVNHNGIAARMAGYYPKGVSRVYVATSRSYPDGLSAAARAGTKGAPVLYVDRDSLPTATRNAIRDLDPQRIVIMGGTGAVSTSVKRALGNALP
ncbi:MAG TPA: cell wall-binding repeat-containing protein [Ornithinimicrobium sp.]|uniref:cell wall-binding repeat-containing protein n=1 Tax=Ornithinimicrobium sp. TaxID=1977084 RepID=UPI002B4A2C47|nr:cell wall-binding repeat-containing protein [Ornithinimicrobium sp.]HKJ11054.1 cell wall-binding repeat-containing protein [Ornithinimicrobium sp.]